MPKMNTSIKLFAVKPLGSNPR